MINHVANDLIKSDIGGFKEYVLQYAKEITKGILDTTFVGFSQKKRMIKDRNFLLTYNYVNTEGMFEIKN